MKVHRGVVYSRKGAVASSQPLAVSAALDILKKGGSFIDAGIAASAVLAVVEPGASQLGGDAFLITYHAQDKEVLAFNGSGEAPHGANREAFPMAIDFHGYRAATVPGVVSTWFAAHDRFGKLAMSEILAAAIDYAKNGFPANAGWLRRMKGHLELFPETQLFKTMGVSTDVQLGDLVIQSDLAWTLEEIAQNGRAAFYTEKVAERMIAATDGWISAEDLAAHSTRVGEPLTIRYGDLVIHGQPPPSQGMILMEELLLASGFDLAGMDEVDRIHLLVESKKLAFADRNRILADPEKISVNVQSILDPNYITRRRSEINMTLANNRNSKPGEEGSDTTYFLIADSTGNAVSWIQSVYHGFGASWAAAGTGVVFNNRLTGFSLDPQSPNFIAPGKRPAHTLNAWIATNLDGSLRYVSGTPGANIQVQTNLQIIVNMADLGMNVQEAVEAPRWQHLSDQGESGFDEARFGTLFLEERIPMQIVEKLKERGHIVSILPPWGHGSSVQLLEVLANGTYAIGSDPRSEGHAAGI